MNTNELCNLAQIALQRMYIPGKKRFCFREYFTSTGVPVKEGISYRYTAMAVIGLQKALLSGKADVWDNSELDLIRSSLYSERHELSDFGDMGLLLWMLSDSKEMLAKELMTEITSSLGKTRMMDKLSAMSLAFLLSGVAAYLHNFRSTDRSLNTARLICEALLKLNNRSQDLFHGYPKKDLLRLPRYNISSFASQIYPIYALTRYSQELPSTEALDVASKCANKIISLQDESGGWCWQYDVPKGTVAERYPFFSVHQDGMAPFALMQLDEYRPIAGISGALQKGLAWLDDTNQMQKSMVSEEANTIFRAISKNGTSKLNAQNNINYLSAILGSKYRLHLGSSFAVIEECRPYHLGWILLAWS